MPIMLLLLLLIRVKEMASRGAVTICFEGSHSPQICLLLPRIFARWHLLHQRRWLGLRQGAILARFRVIFKHRVHRIFCRGIQTPWHS